MLDGQRKSKYFIGGLLAGSVIGSLAGLLFAPKSGKELRKNISEKGSGMLEDTNELLENAKSKASEIISDAKKKAGELLDDGIKKFDSFTHGADDLVQNGKEKVEEGISKVKAAVKSGSNAPSEKSNSQNKGSSNHSSDIHEDEKGKYNKSKV